MELRNWWRHFLPLVIFSLVLLAILIAKHFTISSDLNYAREVIDARDEEIALCWKLNQSKVSDPQVEQFARIDIRVQELQPRLDHITRKKIVDAVLQNCDRYKLSPSLVIHLIYRESRFNPLSRSKKSAIGLMQVMYKVHAKHNPELAKIKPEELYHIDNNIRFGCQILRGYINSTKSLDKALKKYVGGQVDGYVADIFRMMAQWEQGRCNPTEGGNNTSIKR